MSFAVNSRPRRFVRLAPLLPAGEPGSDHRLRQRLMYGELLPLGGGDPIPLLKANLLVGRRESADIVLRFPNVSGHHCELSLADGYWTIKDLRSSNGTKVNGVRVTEQKLRPGDKLSIAKHEYEISFDPLRLGGKAPPVETSQEESVFSRSLLESAGLETKPRGGSRATAGRPRRPGG